MSSKPIQHLAKELFTSNRNSTAVIGTWHFPKDNLSIAKFDSSRVADRNIAVDLSVNQQDGNVGLSDDLLGLAPWALASGISTL